MYVPYHITQQFSPLIHYCMTKVINLKPKVKQKLFSDMKKHNRKKMTNFIYLFIKYHQHFSNIVQYKAARFQTMYITLLAAYIQTRVPLGIYTHVDTDFEFFLFHFQHPPMVWFSFLYVMVSLNHSGRLPGQLYAF